MVRLKGALYRKIQERKKRKQVEKKEKEHVKVEQKKMEQKRPKKGWEYRVIALKTKAENWTEILSKLGEEEWELVAVIPMFTQSRSKSQVRCFFKRRVEKA